MHPNRCTRRAFSHLEYSQSPFSRNQEHSLDRSERVNTTPDPHPNDSTKLDEPASTKPVPAKDQHGDILSVGNINPTGSSDSSVNSVLNGGVDLNVANPSSGGLVIERDVRVGSPFAIDPPLRVRRSAHTAETFYDFGPARYLAWGAVFASGLVLLFAIGCVVWFPAGGVLVASLGGLLAITGLFSPRPWVAGIFLTLHIGLFMCSAFFAAF